MIGALEHLVATKQAECKWQKENAQCCFYDLHIIAQTSPIYLTSAPLNCLIQEIKLMPQYIENCNFESIRLS